MRALRSALCTACLLYSNQAPSPAYLLQRPAQFGGFGGFNRGPQQSELALGPSVDIEQLQKDLERSQVGGAPCACWCLAVWYALECSAHTHGCTALHTAHFTTLPASCVQAALDKLPGELKAQQANAAKVERRLQREKGGWVRLEGRPSLPREFVQASPASAPKRAAGVLQGSAAAHAVCAATCQPAWCMVLPSHAALPHCCPTAAPLLQYCVLPRMLNSPTDALYCARFFK